MVTSSDKNRLNPYRSSESDKSVKGSSHDNHDNSDRESMTRERLTSSPSPERHVDVTPSRDQGSEFASSGSERRGADLREEARQMGQQAKDEALEATNRLLRKGKERAREVGIEQRRRITSELDALSSSLQKAGDEFNEESETQMGDYLCAAAEQVKRFERHLEERDLGEIASEVRSAIRRNPELALGGCFVVGLGIARFLKSSQDRRAENRETGSGSYSPRRNRRYPDSPRVSTTPNISRADSPTTQNFRYGVRGEENSSSRRPLNDV